MSESIPDDYVDLLTGPVVVSLATVNPDGQPQVTPVWCNYDGTHILVNTARGRQKERNMRERPQATVLAIDPDDPYRYLEVRARVVDSTEEGAVDHIDELARLYRGVEQYYGNSAPAELRHTETRVKFRLEPEHVVASG